MFKTRYNLHLTHTTGLFWTYRPNQRQNEFLPAAATEARWQWHTVAVLLNQAGCVCVLRTESDNMQNFFSTLSACQYTVCTCFRGAANILTHTHIWELISLSVRTHWSYKSTTSFTIRKVSALLRVHLYSNCFWSRCFHTFLLNCWLGRSRLRFIKGPARCQ